MTIPDPPFHVSPETYAAIDTWGLVLAGPVLVVVVAVHAALYLRRRR